MKIKEAWLYEYFMHPDQKEGGDYVFASEHDIEDGLIQLDGWFSLHYLAEFLNKKLDT